MCDGVAGARVYGKILDGAAAILAWRGRVFETGFEAPVKAWANYRIKRIGLDVIKIRTYLVIECP